MSWTRVATAKNLAEATLVRDVLVAGGVDARLRGEGRPSIAGEIPLPDALVEVVVDGTQFLRAKALLAAVEDEAAGPDWTCGCGEENPATFEVCWKCGESRQ
ncbi:MAG: putative signal transducing protein [Myxococcota bacterium]